MTETVGTGGREESRELGHQIGEWIAGIDRDTHALQGNIEELRQKYMRLIALAEQIRSDMKSVCLDFDNFDDDLGHISDAIHRMNLPDRHHTQHQPAGKTGQPVRPAHLKPARPPGGRRLPGGRQRLSQATSRAHPAWHPARTSQTATNPNGGHTRQG